MNTNLKLLIPQTKFDLERAEAIRALGFPTIEPILPSLMEWMQDINWPVARVLQPLLAGIGTPLEPHLRFVLQTEDSIWKYSVLDHIVRHSTELIHIFTPELQRLAHQPSQQEKSEELDSLALELLNLSR